MLKITKNLQKDFTKLNYLLQGVILLCKSILYCYNLTLYKMKCIVHSLNLIVLKMIFLFKKPHILGNFEQFFTFFKKKTLLNCLF